MNWVISAFETEFKWIGLLGCHGKLHGLVLGQANPPGVVQYFREKFSLCDTELLVEDWNPDLREALECYTRGELIDFTKWRDSLGFMHQHSEFAKRVIHETIQIPYGETMSYSALAEAGGSPKAARAAGSIMAKNTIPILIPCHRVVGKNGDMRGFSAGGVETKSRLLMLENQSFEKNISSEKSVVITA